MFGGLTENYSIMECMGEKFNYDTQKWDKLEYEGFVFPFFTNATPTTSIPSLQDKSNLFLVGGSNSQDYSPLIKQL